MKLLGIDAGRQGAVALLNTMTDELIIEDAQMEVDGTLDCNWFFTRLTEWEPDAAIIEGVYKPNSLVEQKGEYQACCKLFQLPLTTVPVVRWKTLILSKNTSDKKVSVQKCLELFPQADLNRPTPALRKPTLNPDRSEAALLAEYLRRTL